MQLTTAILMLLATASVALAPRTVRIRLAMVEGVVAEDSVHALTGLGDGMVSEGFVNLDPNPDPRVGRIVGAQWIVAAEITGNATKVRLNARLANVETGNIVGREAVICTPATLQDSARAVGVRFAKLAPVQ